ncbi:VOC family protein [Micromonospora sp. NPDC051543]|uniref:VOC family protein n=1 Tax=Micromonospora sp. NPDC051543 TaxID=3364287 RepID=UPI003787EBAA
MSAIPARLSVVTLGARDLGRLRSFYLSLGWPELPASDDGWSAFQLGGVLLALYPLPELAAEAAPDVADPAGGWSGVTLACNVDDRGEVDAAFEAAVAVGATVVAAPTDRSWGGRSAYIADPEGNRWEIAWAGTAVFDERGALVSFGG